MGWGWRLPIRNRRVLVFDGDGSLLMNLGGLATVADAAPRNFFHFVFVNGTYEVNGAHPIPAAGRVDFAAMASAAGYRHSECWKRIDELVERLPGLLALDGPVLVQLSVEPGARHPRDYPYIHSPEARQRFRTALNANWQEPDSS